MSNVRYLNQFGFRRNSRKRAKSEAKALADEYGITDSGGLALLRTYVTAYSLELDCMDVIEKDGLTFVDRYNQIKPHPLLVTARDARNQKMQALKALNLDLEPVRDVGRPSAQGSR